jgi:hypothetical protein
VSRRRTEHSSRVRRVSLGLCRAHETRREHLLELQEQFGFQFTSAHYRQFTAELVSLAEPLTAPLSEDQKKKRETLLNIRGGTHQTLLAWLRQPAGAPSARNLLDYVTKLQALRQVGLLARRS